MVTTNLFDRRYRLTMNGVQVSELDVIFSVDRSLKKEPNTAEIQIFNLSPESRSAIEENAQATVTLEAGYKERISLIFTGDLRDVLTEREGPDIITTLGSGDGEKKYRRSRVNESFKPGTSIKRVITVCAEALGVGRGNLGALGKVEFPEAGAVYPNGTILAGNAAEELHNLLRSVGLEYSIQDGNLQIVTRKRALKKEAIVLSPESGLIGTASVGSDGILRCQTLMIPDLIPGVKVQVKSETVQEDIRQIQARGRGRRHLEGFSGTFRALKCGYNGDLAGTDWGIDLQADPLFKVAA